MNKLGITSQNVHLIGSFKITDLRRLDRRTRYRVKGFQFSTAYQEKRWDGYVRLMKVERGGAGARLPIGLYDEAVKFLSELGEFKVVDKRSIPSAKIKPCDWPSKFEPRTYQEEAVDSVFEKGLGFLHGVIRSPVRSGKTVIQAQIVHRLGRRAVVLVGSKSALEQTKNVFTDVFGASEVGVIGDGKRERKAITIASVQSSTFDSDDVRAAFDDAALVLIDEFHHYTKGKGRGKKGRSWKDFVENLDVPYKLGFSGTIYFDEKKGSNEEDIWLRAIAGPIVYSITIRQLIELGYLVEPTIYFVPFDGVIEGAVFSEQYKNLLLDPTRNAKIVAVATRCSEIGHKTIIVTSRIEHAEKLREGLDGANVRHAMLTGPSHLWERKKVYKRFCDADSDLNVMVGTVFNETVDLPPATVVINASGGSSRGSTIQKLRNITSHPGKETAIVFDFADTKNKYFKRHSRERLKHYRAEGLKCRLLSGSVEEILG